MEAKGLPLHLHERKVVKHLDIMNQVWKIDAIYDPSTWLAWPQDLARPIALADFGLPGSRHFRGFRDQGFYLHHHPGRHTSDSSTLHNLRGRTSGSSGSGSSRSPKHLPSAFVPQFQAPFRGASALKAILRRPVGSRKRCCKKAVANMRGHACPA
jgi:hypothetical protein